MMDDRTILYRFFNKSGKLLYVGITKNMPSYQTERCQTASNPAIVAN